MAERIAVAPAAEPITLAELKSQLNITSSTDDILLGRKLKAARVQVERLIGRPIINTTFDQFYDRFPSGAIELPRCPVQSVTSIKYLDATTETETTLAVDQYVTDVVSEPARLVAGSIGWPSTQSTLNAVTVRYVAGYGADATAVPEALREAVLMLAAHYYENREATLVGVNAQQLPFGVAEIVNEYREYSYG